MSEPCQQVGPIASLEATTKDIAATLERQEKILDRFLQVLEKIAEQGQQIVNLESGVNRLVKDTDNLFDRVRNLEISDKGISVKVAGIIAGITLAVSGAVTLIARHI